MAFDSLLPLQAEVTKTASFNSASVDLKTGSGRHMFARVLYKDATNASGSNSVTFSVEHSTDNSNWYLLSSGAMDVVNLSTTAQAKEIWMSVFTKSRYIRLVATVAGAGSTPTITYSADVSLTAP